MFMFRFFPTALLLLLALVWQPVFRTDGSGRQASAAHCFAWQGGRLAAGHRSRLPVSQVQDVLSGNPAGAGAQHLGGNVEQSLLFERRHLLFGAITGSDTRDRYGNYFTFFWRAQRPANLTVRLEYRQQKLGSMVQAREVTYPDANGSFITRFSRQRRRLPRTRPRFGVACAFNRESSSHRGARANPTSGDEGFAAIRRGHQARGLTVRRAYRYIPSSTQT